MSLETNVSDLATRVATESKALRTLINGNVSNLSALTTTDKTNLVAAINEVAAAVGGAGATIDDGTVSTLTVWSSDKTNDEIDAAIAAVLDTAPGALDTLNELAAALADDPNFATTMTTALAGKVGTTGSETIAGVKTFSSAPVVPDASFAIAKTSGLQAALDAKITGFADPNADRIVFWDDSATAYAALTPGAGLAITTTTIAATVATDAAAGIVELATNGEAQTGTDTVRAVTPAALAAVTATETRAGLVELATSAEAIAGTDTARAITPAGLAAVVGDSTENFVTIFEAGLV